VTGAAPLNRVSAVDALVAALRDRILDGELEAGSRLIERELTEEYGVARHTLRAALRGLAADGLVRLEPNRGAFVALLSAEELHGIYDLRRALELEAAHLALERNDGRVPREVRDAVRALAAVCRRKRPPWSAVAEAHNEVHRALVRASGSARIVRAYEALAGELTLVVRQLRPHWTLDRMAAGHERLLDDLERVGTPALRAHLDEALVALTRSEAP
jgi:DNA-binding GntR family transcriptional regulator